MSSIEGLKEQARSHEQREHWNKALELYAKAIEKLEQEDQPDIALYNRVGDLFTRTGQTDRAVEHYERAVDLYMDAELPNNAIAVCKKIIRNLPDRHAVFLRMGRIRAAQGFLVDARTCYLTYAERIESEGDIEEALRALSEFADVVPDDSDVRMKIASHFQRHERFEEAIAQLAAGYSVLMSRGDVEGAAEFEARAREIDPDASLASWTPPTETSEEFAAEPGPEQDQAPMQPAVQDEPGGEIEVEFDLPEADEEETVVPGSGFVSGFGPSAAVEETESIEDDDDIGGELPLIPFEEEEVAIEPEADIEDRAEAPPSPGIGSAGTQTDDWIEPFEEEEDIGGELPLLGSDQADRTRPEVGDTLEAAAEEVAPLGRDLDRTEVAGGVPTRGDRTATGPVRTEGSGIKEKAGLEEEEDPRATFDRLATEADASPKDVSIPRHMVEVAFRTADENLLADAYLRLGRTLQRTGDDARAGSVFQQVLAIDPGNAEAISALESVGSPTREVREVAASEEYVDLGALILGDEEEKTTRFVVAYEEPSGDEAADFRKMLSQFKEKVAENFEASDVKAHHDLGTAYKEMGLLDEAVAEFQQALRASGDHLPTYELLGQVFMEKGENEAAVRVMTRALKTNPESEDDLLGIYYYLGRAHEELGRTSEAVDFYDRVFALDINFADVTERLRTLR